MTVIHSYSIVHYGKDYINAALQSVLPFVEQAHIFYTPLPSHGQQSSVRPIETSEEIQEEIKQLNTDKILWHNTSRLKYEGNQRDYAVKFCKDAGADIIIVLDYDEVWPVETLQRALEIVEYGQGRNWLINFTHLWRSFNHCCRDQGWPVRFIDLRVDDDSNGFIPKEAGDIYHFGYAITDKVMKYKWEIHGHKSEMRPGWLDNQWQQKPPVENCHPTNSRNEEDIGFWNTEPFDKYQLPEFVRQHKFWHLDKIK